MALSLGFNIGLPPSRHLSRVSHCKPLRKLRSKFKVVVSAEKNRGSEEGFSKRYGRPRKRYSPISENLEDISALYSHSGVVKKSFILLKNCTDHINHFVEKGNLFEAQTLFDLMVEKGVDPNAYTYTVLMKGYSRKGFTNRVCALFEEMEKKDIKPTLWTFVTMILSYRNNGDIESSLSLLDTMKNKYWLEPDKYIYGALLNVCASASDLVAARRIYKEYISSDVEYDIIIFGTMIDVYAQCCNEENGEQYLKECREIMEDMEDRGIIADEETYNTLLKLCSRSNLTTDAINILDEIKSNGLFPTVISYSTVIDGISKDKKLSNAEVLDLSSKILHTMEKEDIQWDNHTYCSLLSVAIRLRDLDKATRLFNEMKRLRIRPSSVTYGNMIKCYEKLGDPSNGDAYLKPLLNLMKECERNRTKFYAEGYNSLLTACAKASNINEALRIWNKMKKDKIRLNSYLYNTLLNVYLSCGDKRKAIKTFEEMKKQGFNPNTSTYAIMIKCYEKLGDPSDSDAYLKPWYTSLLTACTKASNLDEASRIWSKMIAEGIRMDAILYTAMINSCLNKDNKDRAFELLSEMKAAEVTPNDFTYKTFLSYFVKEKDRLGGKQIYNEMQTGETSSLCQEDQSSNDTVSLIVKYNEQIKDCIERRSLSEAEEVFGSMVNSGVDPNVTTYKTMMIGYSAIGATEKILELFEKLRSKNTKKALSVLNATVCVWPIDEHIEGMLALCIKLNTLHGMTLNRKTYDHLLKKCAIDNNLEAAKGIVRAVVSTNVNVNSGMCCELFYIYAACISEDNGRQYYHECTEILQEMENKNVKTALRTYNALLRVCSRGKVAANEVMEILDAMESKGVQPNILTFNRALYACANGGDKGKALLLYEKLKIQNSIVPNQHTYTPLLKACANTRDLDTAKVIFEEMISTVEVIDEAAFNVMLNVYAECCTEDNSRQMLRECRELIEEMKKRNVTVNIRAYNIMIKLCARGGLADEAMNIFNEIERANLKITVRTLNTVLHAYANAGYKDKAYALFERMEREYGFKADKFTYSLLLRVCAKAQDLKTAKNTLEKMNASEVESDSMELSTMLNVYAECCDTNNARQYLKECRRLINKAESKGIRLNKWVCGTLLKLCSKGSLMTEAMILLKEMRIKRLPLHALSYNTVIDGLSKDKNISSEKSLELSLEILEEFRKNKIQPDAYTFTSLQKLAYRIDSADIAVSWFTKLRTLDILPGKIIEQMMTKYLKRLDDPLTEHKYLKPCLNLFKQSEDNETKKCLKGYSVLLSSCVNACDVDAALKIWTEMKDEGIEPDTFAYCAMLTVYVNSGDAYSATKLFNEMKKRKVPLNSVAYSIMIKCCKDLCSPLDKIGYLRLCLCLHEECDQSGIKLSAEGYASLISACANAANFNEALKKWKKMIHEGIKPNLFVYTAMIKACLSEDKLSKAFDFLNEMKGVGIQPSEVTYRSFISHFVWTEDKRRAEAILKEMQVSKIQPSEVSRNRVRIFTCSAASSEKSVHTSGKLRTQIINAATELLFSSSQKDNRELELESNGTELVLQMIETYFEILQHRNLKASHLHDILYLSSRAIIKFQTPQFMIQKKRSFFEHLFNQIQSKLPNFNNRQMAIMIWSIGELGPYLTNLSPQRDPSMDQFITDLVQWSSRKLDGFNEREVVRIVSAFVQLGSPDLPVLVPGLLKYCKRYKESFKPEDLCTISWNLARMQVMEGKEILENLGTTIRSKLRSITPLGLSRFLWASGQLHAKFTPYNVGQILKKIEINLRILAPRDVSRVLQGLSEIQFKPRFEFFDMVEVYFTNQVASFTPSQIVTMLNAFGNFGYASETVIKVSKAYILDYHEKFTFHELCSILSALSLLDALDLEFLELALVQAEAVNEGPFKGRDGERRLSSKIGDEALRQLFQGALHLEVFKNDDIQWRFPPGFYDICKGSWTVYHLFSPVNDVVSHLVQNFEYIGYKCESPFFETTSKFNLTCVRCENGARILVEVVTETDCFLNDMHQIKGAIKWRHRMLKTLGWPLMIIFEDVWMAMDFQEQAKYLSENILPLLDKNTSLTGL
eukprot:g293.t1